MVTVYFALKQYIETTHARNMQKAAAEKKRECAFVWYMGFCFIFTLRSKSTKRHILFWKRTLACAWYLVCGSRRREMLVCMCSTCGYLFAVHIYDIVVGLRVRRKERSWKCFYLEEQRSAKNCGRGDL